MHLYISRPSQNCEVGKKKVSRSKEKLCYVDNPAARASSLCKRKRTLFNKGMKLHVMTKAEVLIIIEKGQQRYVCGKDDILKRYENEELKPKESDKKIKDGTVETDDQMDALGVCPLEDTPDKLDLDHNLATVLGHSKESTSTVNPRRNERFRSLQLVDRLVSEPVMQLLLNRASPQLNEEELSCIDPVQVASKITFVSDDSVEVASAN